MVLPQRGRIHALDKQPLRDWLATTGVSGVSGVSSVTGVSGVSGVSGATGVTGGAEQAALDLPAEVILGVYERYARAYELLCGKAAA